MLEKIYSEITQKMEKTVSSLKEELASYRTGRANPNVLNKIKVEFYGVSNPIAQLATITVPDSKTIVISPFDKASLGEINKAIQKSDIGINPQVDGNIIRLSVPPLTGERRQEIVKLIKKRSEEFKVNTRNHRRDCMEVVKKAKNDSHISEDDVKKATDKIQKITDQYIAKIDEITEAKSKDILSA